MLWKAGVLLFFRLSSRTGRSVTMQVFLHDMESKTALDEADEKQGYVCLRWVATHEGDHSAVGDEELNNRMELDVAECFGVGPFNETGGIVQIVRGSYEIPLLSRTLLWLYHRQYGNRFYIC